MVALVDQILEKNAELNRLREEGYTIRHRRDGTALIDVPYDQLLREAQSADPGFPTLTLFQARAAGQFTIPDKCDLAVQIGSNVFTPDKYPATVVLRHNKLWLEVPDDALRRYLRGYLGRPQWRGRTWDEIKSQASVPADAASLITFFAQEAQQASRIQTLLAEVADLDRRIDERVLDLYGITASSDRVRILGSAPPVDEQEDAMGDSADSGPQEAPAV